MVEKKTIQVNKDFLSLSHRMTKKKEKEKKIKKKRKPLEESKKIKKDFFKNVQNFQEQREKSLKNQKNLKEQKTHIENFESEFDKSLGFLQNIVKERSDKVQPKEKLPICLDIPDSFNDSTSITPVNIPTISLSPSSPSVSSSNNSPPYSNLKNSKKPTYRQWIKTTQKSSVGMKPSLQIENKPDVIETERSKKLDEFKKRKEEDQPSIKKITKVFKRTLGKKGKTVSVLIKNKETRRNVKIERAKLSQKPVAEVKKYLKERNFIKCNSTSPHDVLRCMYDSCILSGDLQNKNSDNLMHNFLNS